MRAVLLGVKSAEVVAYRVVMKKKCDKVSEQLCLLMHGSAPGSRSREMDAAIHASAKSGRCWCDLTLSTCVTNTKYVVHPADRGAIAKICPAFRSMSMPPLEESVMAPLRRKSPFANFVRN